MRDNGSQSTSEPPDAQGAIDARQGASADRSLLDAQMALIERRLAAPLSEAQRRQVADRLSDGRSRWTEEQIATVPDGTEPDVIFRALTRASAAEDSRP